MWKWCIKSALCGVLALSASGAFGVPCSQARERGARLQRIGVQPNVDSSFGIGSDLLALSPDEKWLVSRDSSNGNGLLWNVTTRAHRPLEGYRVVFSNDSRHLAVQTEEFITVQDVGGRVLWKRKTGESENLIGFCANDARIQTQTEHRIRFYDARSGRLGAKRSARSPWRTTDLVHKNGSLFERISFVPAGARKPRFSFHTSNEYDVWDLSPDKRQLWVSLNEQKRFDVLDATTGQRLWFYRSDEGDSGQFRCYPKWERGGQTLATIEHDHLVVRDARTGRVLLKHKNTLPARLVSWAFTRDGRTVYLMDQRGAIFRGRLL